MLNNEPDLKSLLKSYARVHRMKSNSTCSLAERRIASAGLGASGSKLANSTLYSSAGSYRETLRSLTKARYEDTYK